jgi:hypothetical protein
MRPAAKYLLILESAGAMTARLFDAERRHLSDFDAASEEVAVMTKGLYAQQGARAGDWGSALGGHSPAELAEAQVYVLDV